MALFGGNSTEHNQATGQQAAEDQNANQNYFDDFEGEGQEQLTPDMLSTPYLSMVQAGGSAAANGHDPGTWINSASGENFGPEVEVICLACKTAWIERDTTGKTWMTVGRYEPNSIEVTKTMPKPGQRGFPTMVNPETGNKIEELFVYALTLKASPEAGVLFFSPTAISMSACKAWNTKIRNQRLPSGKLAPIFAFSWILGLGTVPKPGAKGNPDDPSNRNTKLLTANRGSLVALDLFKNYVQPQLSAGQNLLAIAAPEADEDGTNQ
jgi:hypothetical protein